MDVRVIVFVSGPEFEEMASLTMPRAEQVLGTSVERISTPPDSYMPSERLRYMSTVEHDDPILLIDADMVFRSWDWAPFKIDQFNGVLDYTLEGWAGGNLRQQLGLDATKAINGGMWLATRRFARTFNHSEALRKELVRQDYFLRMGDQIALNMALQQHHVPINYIPNEYNIQVSPVMPLDEVPEDARVVHLVGNSVAPGETYNPKRKLERVKEALDVFPLD